MFVLAEVRTSGRCNMFDFPCVVTTIHNLGYELQADWLEQHPDSYGKILMREFPQWLRDNPPPPQESLAQRVARETGMEVIED